jgi:hypothetical protein
MDMIERFYCSTNNQPAAAALPGSAAQSLNYAATNFTAMDGERRREDDPSA